MQTWWKLRGLVKELFSTGQEMNPTIMPKSALIAEYYGKRVLVFGVSFASFASLCLGIKKQCAEVEKKAPSQNKMAFMKGKWPLEFQSVVLSGYETDSINLRQYINLKNNSQEVRLQLDTVFLKKQRIFENAPMRPSNRVGRNVSGDNLKLWISTWSERAYFSLELDFKWSSVIVFTLDYVR